MMEQVGPPVWTALHHLAHRYPVQPTAEDMAHALAFVRSIAGLLPCAKCRRHFAQLLAQMPPRVTDRDAFARWSVDAHNAVNARLGKPAFGYEQAQQLYGERAPADAPLWPAPEAQAAACSAVPLSGPAADATSPTAPAYPTRALRLPGFDDTNAEPGANLPGSLAGVVGAPLATNGADQTIRPPQSAERQPLQPSAQRHVIAGAIIERLDAAPASADAPPAWVAAAFDGRAKPTDCAQPQVRRHGSVAATRSHQALGMAAACQRLPKHWVISFATVFLALLVVVVVVVVIVSVLNRPQRDKATAAGVVAFGEAT
jgi:hypothetical protein